jgi:hypothetical protein
MEQVSDPRWPFDVPPDEAVLTTKYVTAQHMPILLVMHQVDEEDGVIWQFHCDNDDYRSEVLQLVQLKEVLALDSTVESLASMPTGYTARRERVGEAWNIQEDRE